MCTIKLYKRHKNVETKEQLFLIQNNSLTKKLWQVYPSWRMTDQMVVDLHQAGLQMDAKPQEPLTTSVLTPQQISAKFSGLTYSKGNVIIRVFLFFICLNVSWFKGTFVA
jgi:hypothetical protein